MSVQTQQYRCTFSSGIGKIYMSKWVRNHLEQAVITAASMYPDEVPATLDNVIDRSFANIAYHNPEEFIEYGDYRILDLIVKQVSIDAMYGRKTRPHIVVLYGPPGTGKTTWVRNAVAKHMIREDTLTGIYLEVTPGDFSSKFAGVPIAFLKSLVNTVSVTNFASVLLFDEADGILLKPRDASGGIEIEQHKLVSELKSALSILLSMHYPLVVVFTTNYKDTIVKADAALADRVTAWIEVLPPPNWARIAMAKNLLPSAIKCLWEGAPGFIYATVFRAVRRGAEPPTLNPLWVENPWFPFKIPWIVPVLPYEADFLIGYLIAWGWSPLEKDLADALTLDFSRAVALWDKNNPLLKVYGRGIASEIEMMRRYDEEKNKIEKSFLRSFHAAKRGIDEFEKILSVSYKQFWSGIILENRELIMGEKITETLEWRKDQLVCSLMVHGIPPSLIHHSISKSLPFKEFIDIVNQVLSTIGIVTNPIRHLFLPFIVSYTEDPLMRFIEFRRKIGVYNKLIYRE
ncbi:MAG: ATP-binding protein, partial [Ignisphaera sp.]